MSDEEEFFHKRDQEAKAKLAAKLEAQQAEADRVERKKLHFHKCGKCGSDMTTNEFRGVEIEVCTECASVLLDPGELEELAGSEPLGGLFTFLKNMS